MMDFLRQLAQMNAGNYYIDNALKSKGKNFVNNLVKGEDLIDTAYNQQTPIVPSEAEIQRNIQKEIQPIAPKPTNTTPQVKTRLNGFYGVTQAGQGILGMLKSLVQNNTPTLQPITAKNALSMDFYNQVLANISRRNRARYAMALANVLGNMYNNTISNATRYQTTLLNTQTEKDIANKKNKAMLEATKMRTDTQKEYNKIMQDYYNGLLSQKDLELKLKALSSQKGNNQDYLQRLKKYPSPTQFLDDLKNYYESLGYDFDVKDPQQINQAYEYYLKTGQLPTPKEVGGWGNNNIESLNIPMQQPQQPVIQTQQKTNIDPNKILNEAKQSGIKAVSVVSDKDGNIYVVDENGDLHKYVL